MMSSIARRSFLRAGLGAAAAGTAAASCSAGASSPAASAGGGLIGPGSPQVAAAQAARYATGRVVPAALDAVAGVVDLGGVTVRTWSYRGEVPGPEIRVRRGDAIEAVLANRLPAPTTVHWHGIAVRDNMDGVPGLTQAPVAPGHAFTYRFTADEAGTYWYHPHAGTQLDRGLYGPLIVEDPGEPAPYDHDWTVVLDDWIDGAGYTPDQVLAALRGGMSGMTPAPASPSPAMPGTGAMPGMSPAGQAGAGPLLSGAASPLLGGDAGDVRYPYYLINGRVRAAPRTFTARPGQRARIRFINAVVVAIAVLAALTLLPALLSILGTRVNAVRIPFLERRPGSLSRPPAERGATDRPAAGATAGGRGFWHAWALAVMRRPAITILGVLLLIALLGWPALALKVGVPGADVLSAQSSERQGLTILQQQFPALPQDPIDVVVQARNGGSILAQGNLEEVDRLTTWIAAQQHVTSVTGLTAVPAAPGTPTSSTGQLAALYSSGNYRHVPALARFVSSVAAGDTTVIVAQSDTTLESDQGKALIEHLRADAPAVSQGLDIRVGGLQALSLDLDSALYRNFPRTILVILATTYLLLLLMFRSVLLPLKAVLMNTLSVGATYGALVYIFQWGNLGFPRVAFIDAIIPILLFCVLFGLSMDYEVFLLSRIREEWLQSEDNRAAVASGLEKTAGVITSAACLFVIVTGAFAFASLVTTKEIGVGMTVAVLVDATFIRLLLVPATMRLLGRWNWWLPGRPMPPR